MVYDQESFSHHNLFIHRGSCNIQSNYNQIYIQALNQDSSRMHMSSQYNLLICCCHMYLQGTVVQETKGIFLVKTCIITPCSTKCRTGVTSSDEN